MSISAAANWATTEIGRMGVIRLQILSAIRVASHGAGDAHVWIGATHSELAPLL
jgi:hypothetical protein